MCMVPDSIESKNGVYSNTYSSVRVDHVYVSVISLACIGKHVFSFAFRDKRKLPT
jgi:hypothetical protein